MSGRRRCSDCGGEQRGQEICAAAAKLACKRRLRGTGCGAGVRRDSILQQDRCRVQFKKIMESIHAGGVTAVMRFSWRPSENLWVLSCQRPSNLLTAEHAENGRGGRRERRAVRARTGIRCKPWNLVREWGWQRSFAARGAEVRRRYVGDS
jgi:hypothetical protein